VEGKYVMTEVILRPSLRIPSSVDPTRAERVLQKSESACLITNSVRAKVSMVPEIKI
jgi:organic hydroperoxide reductase OsmC/OhrA